MNAMQHTSKECTSKLHNILFIYYGIFYLIPLVVVSVIFNHMNKKRSTIREYIKQGKILKKHLILFASASAQTCHFGTLELTSVFYYFFGIYCILLCIKLYLI